MKAKNFIIQMDIYDHDLMVSVGEADEILFKKLVDAGVDKEEVSLAEFEHTGKGRFCLFKNGQSLIRIHKKPETPEDYGFLQHEIFHVAASLMWRIGVKLKIETSDEAYAYIIGFLTREIYKKI